MIALWLLGCTCAGQEAPIERPPHYEAWPELVRAAVVGDVDGAREAAAEMTADDVDVAAALGFLQAATDGEDVADGVAEVAKACGACHGRREVTLPSGNRFMAFQHATLQADAYEALGRKDAAAAALESVLKTFPNPRLQQRIDALRGQDAP